MSSGRESEYTRVVRRAYPGAGGLVLLLLACVGVGCGEPGSAPVRLTDRASGGSLGIDGLWIEGLDASRDEQPVPLPDAPRRGRLVFTIGTKLTGAVVRFEVLLRNRDGRVDSIYRRDVPGGAWVDDEVDLGPYSGSGRTLIFRKALVTGPNGALTGALWGDPVFLPSKPDAGPLVILISIDTLRADRVGTYAPRNGAVTPTLDALAASGALFEAAYSPSTWTLPSHRALLSGRFPAEVPVPKPLPSIAETLRSAGYLTAGFTGGGYVGRFFGLNAGFDRFFEYTAPEGSGAPACTPEHLDGPEVFRRASEWLRRFGRHPGFLFVHTYDAHDRCPFFTAAFQKPPFALKDVGAIRKYYAAMVTRVDQLLAGLVREVDQLDRDGPTLLIVTSDHGEALYEHKNAGHGPDMRPYEELAHVPLLVRLTGAGRGLRVDEPVALVDVAPTVLAAAGLPIPAEMRGRVLPGLGLPSTSSPHPVWVDAGAALAVRIGTEKLVSEPATPANDQVVDLVRDPGESMNLRSQRPALYDALLQHAAEFARYGTGSYPGTTDQYDPALRERLRALGYAR